MIMQELMNLYDRLAADEDVQISRLGWTVENVAWKITLTRTGDVTTIVPLTAGEGKAERPYVARLVPEHVKRTSGVKPYFLCDSAAYFFALDTKRGEAMRAATRELHEAVLADVRDDGAAAVLAMLSHDVNELLSESDIAKLETGGNIVFELDGDTYLIHERPAIATAWERYATQDDGAPIGMCSITGEKAPLCNLYPQIKGLSGAQSSGASLVSMNEAAMMTYGKSRTYNASISKRAAFATGTALQYVLKDPEHKHSVLLGDMHIAFWPCERADAEAQVMKNLVALEAQKDKQSDNDTPDAETTRKLVQANIENIKLGRPLVGLNENVRFCVLGIAPNAARLAVKFYEESTFGDLATHFGEYLRDIQIEGNKTTSLHLLLCQTAPLGKPKNVPKPLIKEAFEAMLTGRAFPPALSQLVLSRMRADHAANNDWDMPQRAALLKACLVRKQRLQGKTITKEELIDVSLNKENTNVGYVLGRLFAVMERAQQAALGETNATIKDRYIGAASTTPKRVFTPLLRGYHTHVTTLRKKKPGLCVTFEKEMDQIVGECLKGIDAIPGALSSDEQAAFHIGYFQERNHLWKSRAERDQNTVENTTNNENEEE